MQGGGSWQPGHSLTVKEVCAEVGEADDHISSPQRQLWVSDPTTESQPAKRAT